MNIYNTCVIVALLLLKQTLELTIPIKYLTILDICQSCRQTLEPIISTFITCGLNTFATGYRKAVHQKSKVLHLSSDSINPCEVGCILGAERTPSSYCLFKSGTIVGRIFPRYHGHHQYCYCYRRHCRTFR